MKTHDIAGARAEVELSLDVPVERLWSLITDVSRIGEWSPEATYGEWLDDEGPAEGARFDARNEFPNGLRTQVRCVVVESQEPHVFAYEVYADAGSETPLATWRYELRPCGPDGSGTEVRQSFVHEEGESGVSRAMRDDPDNADKHLAARLEQLREHMTTTLHAMARSESGMDD